MNDVVNIKINDVTLEVEGCYQPEEEPVLYYRDGSGYPGCFADFDISKITYKGQDVTDLVLGLVDHFELEKKCLEAIANQANMFDESD